MKLLINNLLKLLLSKESFLNGAIIYGIGSALPKLSGVLLLPIITKILTLEDFGKYDLLISSSSLLSILALLQIESAFSRYYYIYKRNNSLNVLLNTTINLVLISGVFFSFITFILFKIFYTGISIRGSLVISSLFLIIFQNTSTIFNVLFRFKEERIYYLVGQIFSTFVLIVFSIALVHEMGIIGLILAQCLALACLILFFSFRVSVKWKPEINKSTSKELLRYSLPLVPNVLSNWLSTNSSRILIISMLSIASYSNFIGALKISSIISILTSAVRMNWLPFFYKNYEDNPNAFQRIFDSLIAISGILLLLLFILENKLFLVFLNSTYTYQSGLILFLAIGLINSSLLTQFVNLGPSVSNKTYLLTVTSFLSVLISMSLGYLFIYFSGLIGMAIALSINSIIILWISHTFTRRTFDYNLRLKRFWLLQFIILMSGIIKISDLNTNIQFIIGSLLMTPFIILLTNDIKTNKSIT